MWLFSWGSQGADSAYDIGDHVASFDGKSMWALFKAKKKSTAEPLSVFRYDFLDPTLPEVEQARASLKRLKTLRHPSILKYIDSLEGEKSICIVTEPIRPLEDYLEEIKEDYTPKQRELSMSLGILNVVKGLSFLNNDCNLNHNNIRMHSIFVSSSGAWKIGGLDYICAVGELLPSKPESLSNRYNPPEKLDQNRRALAPKWASDSWGLACLIWESFNGTLSQNSSVKSLGQIPKSLGQYYAKLIASNPKQRISPDDFIKECRSSGTFFNNPFIEAILFLEEIQIRESNEKSKFFSNLENELESFPTDMCRNKILPDMINAFEFGDAGSAILGPIFKIGKMLSDEEYQKKIVPCIVKLFACKDRATRAKLLQQIDTFIHLIQPNVINEQIFPQVAQGFLDSNSTIREQTIKVQQVILIPAFMRAMRDPFPPARSAAIIAIANNESLFSIKDRATKIMPALCHLCVDADSAVRANSFRTLKQLIANIEDRSSTTETTSVQSKEKPVPVQSKPVTKVEPNLKPDLKSVVEPRVRPKIQVPQNPTPAIVEDRPHPHTSRPLRLGPRIHHSDKHL
ncbi:N-terminal kinase-like protein [Fragariocoptes setiger]|uniref:N-terminal kinase-like protein n=1 Tax=Fragariocoptes setiger TaxID=1670756 RepID=A0ABQ7SAF1_9ACAR|nr:N-terminal kinase-like protein [Fragariocoptes setiger]